MKLTEDGFMTMSDAIARVTCGPAKILGIPYGDLSIGRVADICIFNPDTSWRLNEDTMISRGKNSPFHGWEMIGRVHHTLRNGKIIYSA